MAIIGIVLLIGIVQKNAIMMIDFALAAERQEHKKPYDAIHQACLLRFRPILMTTMAAMLGAVPLALGQGVGSELRRPLGIAIIGGLIFSQLLTLYTTPVIYLFFDELSARFARHPKAGAEAPQRKAAARRSLPPRRSSDEPLLPLHQPADRDHAPHGGRGARRRRGVPVPAGLAASPGGFPDDLGLGLAARAQAPRSWPRRWPRRSSASSGGSPA